MSKAKIVVMGVSGSGKSLVADKLAQHFGGVYMDADDYHPSENIEKMSKGIPLTDNDRVSWLKTLNNLIHDTNGIVLACSALTPGYRQQLCENNESLIFVYLEGSIDIIWQRMREREDHYFSGMELLKSQFDTLIAPDKNEAIHVDISKSANEVVQDAIRQIEQGD